MHWTLFASVAAAVVLGGCVTNEVLTPGTRRLRDATGQAPRRRADTLGLAAAILPMGSVPYDGRTLPIVSPDGRFIATEAGDTPDFSVLLATPGRVLPETTGVQVFRLDGHTGTPVHLQTPQIALLLGRSATENHFLVESARRDGARWIGAVEWGGSSTVDWLVRGRQVNAFGCYGPDGRLAWSRREVDAEHFDLVIRHGKSEWVVAEQGGDWLAPTWSRVAGGLYALRLTDGVLELVFLDVAHPGRYDTLAVVRLGDGMTPHDAYQTLAARPHSVVNSEPSGEYLVFYHPSAARMAIWQPLSSPDATALLAEGSIGASLDMTGLALVAEPHDLVAQRPSDPSDRRVIMPGLRIPRPIDDPLWPHLLLSPRDGRIEIVAFALIAN